MESELRKREGGLEGWRDRETTVGSTACRCVKELLELNCFWIRGDKLKG